MATAPQAPTGGVQLPTDPARNRGRTTEGYATPRQDRMPQRFRCRRGA